MGNVTPFMDLKTQHREYDGDDGDGGSMLEGYYEVLDGLDS